MSGEAGFIMSNIVGYFSSIFGVLDTINVFGNFTIVDIALTFLFIDVVLYAILTYINHPYERRNEPEASPGHDAHGPGWKARNPHHRISRYDARYPGGRR